LISSFRLHPLADLTRLWEALHAGKVRMFSFSARRLRFLNSPTRCHV
jgi:hypothetical protein